MKVESIFIDEIRVGTRRRKDFGDINLLAESINELGLIQPIVVDADLNLVAGERRLRACRDVLKWQEVPARLYDSLTEEEHRRIELEENTLHKRLSDLERDSVLVADAEDIAPVISNKLLEIKSPDKNPKKAGRKPKHEAPKEDIAKALGVSHATLTRAEQHVEAAEKYPELTGIINTQADMLTVTKNLDKLPEPERREKLEALTSHDQDVLADLAERPRLVPREKKTPGEKWGKVAYEILKMFASIHSLGGVDELTKSWSAQEKKAYLAQVREMIDELRQIESSLTGVKDDRQAKRKVA
jgi:ParB-like chromosome segregation protein Spo0J